MAPLKEFSYLSELNKAGKGDEESRGLGSAVNWVVGEGVCVEAVFGQRFGGGMSSQEKVPETEKTVRVRGRGTTRSLLDGSEEGGRSRK